MPQKVTLGQLDLKVLLEIQDRRDRKVFRVMLVLQDLLVPKEPLVLLGRKG